MQFSIYRFLPTRNRVFFFTKSKYEIIILISIDLAILSVTDAGIFMAITDIDTDIDIYIHFIIWTDYMHTFHPISFF